MKQYLIVAYAYLVKAGRYNLEAVEGSNLPVVSTTYQAAVAEYLVTSAVA